MPHIPANRPALSRFYFGDFSQWRQVGELLLAGNILAVTLAIGSAPSLREISWFTVLSYSLFTTWVVVCFACFIEKLQPFLGRLRRRSVMLFGFSVLLLIVFVTSCIINILPDLLKARWADITWQNMTAFGLHRILLGAGLGSVALRYLYVREQWLERQHAELIARVQALQARIHPHFLFNSLNSVVSLIVIDPFKAEQMLMDLSGLFRASLTELREVGLQEEIELCKKYLKIESMRLGERLNVKWRIDGEYDLPRAKIPLLTIQPLLENCIYHGIETVSEPGTVSILIDVKGRDVNIVLTNPYQTQKTVGKGNGIALDNVIQRLKAYYGETVDVKSYARHGIFTLLLSYQYQ